MLFFGHVGITLGTALLLAKATIRYPEDNLTLAEHSQPDRPKSGDDRLRASHTPLLNYLTHRFDLRLLLVGSLLPDIIDKPVGHLLFRETFSNGRIFSHTGLFLILFCSLGLFFYRHFQSTGMLVLSFGIAMHLVLDQMWQDYYTLAWPVFGFPFRRVDISEWIPDILNALIRDPQTYIPEIIGFIIIGLFFYWIIRKRQYISFIKTGTING